jgi:hypothetical protein
MWIKWSIEKEDSFMTADFFCRFFWKISGNLISVLVICFKKCYNSRDWIIGYWDSRKGALKWIEI